MCWCFSEECWLSVHSQQQRPLCWSGRVLLSLWAGGWRGWCRGGEAEAGWWWWLWLLTGSSRSPLVPGRKQRVAQWSAVVLALPQMIDWLTTTLSCSRSTRDAEWSRPATQKQLLAHCGHTCTTCCVVEFVYIIWTKGYSSCNKSNLQTVRDVSCSFI